MGSTMLTYSLTFPNSDPIIAVRPANLAYLITAIACSANVPLELIYISYIRANGSVVNFVQPPHNVTGFVKNCSPASVVFRRNLQVVATSNMLVVIYYLSPSPANPSDPMFQLYASSIQGTAPTSGLNTSNSNSNINSNSPGITSGGIAGIIVGVTAVVGIAAGLYAFYVNRSPPRRPISKSSSVVTGPPPHWMATRSFTAKH